MADTLTPAGTARRPRRPPSGKPGANHADGSSGPYSRWLRRGGLGLHINGSSREGRFIRDIEHSLVQQVGGNPTAAQRLLIVRAAKAALRLELFDQRFAAGKTITLHDHKVYSGLQTQYRLLLLAIDEGSRLELKVASPYQPPPLPTPNPAKPPTLAEYLADKARAAEAAP